MEKDSRFDQFYEHGFPAVFKAALVVAGDRDLAEDATQEAFARALERWNSIAEQPWAVGWVVTTALNLVRRAHRRRIRLLPDREAEERDADVSLDLWRAIRALSRRQQEAVALHYIGDLPLEQVAKAMGCENGTVKAHLWRARQQLAKLLGVREDA